MNITDLNECLSELPEISVLDFFRPRNPVRGPLHLAALEKLADAKTPAIQTRAIA